MELLAVNAGDAGAVRLSAADLDRLQWEQFRHDETYHREIARLTVQDRLKHMALHFAKYSGALFANMGDQSREERLVTDIFIIAMSSANILNVRLSERLREIRQPNAESPFSQTITMLSGRMAAACEKLDHLEPYPFREEITRSVVELAAEALAFCDRRGWSLEEMVHGRLQPVKEKSIFYGKL